MKKVTGSTQSKQGERTGTVSLRDLPKKGTGSTQSKQGERTGTVCPVCGADVLKQERFGKNGSLNGHRLVCSKRGCPWQGSVR